MIETRTLKKVSNVSKVAFNVRLFQLETPSRFPFVWFPGPPWEWVWLQNDLTAPNTTYRTDKHSRVYPVLNSLTPGRCGCSFKWIIFKLITLLNILSISSKVAYGWLPDQMLGVDYIASQFALFSEGLQALNEIACNCWRAPGLYICYINTLHWGSICWLRAW